MSSKLRKAVTSVGEPVEEFRVLDGYLVEELVQDVRTSRGGETLFDSEDGHLVHRPVLMSGQQAQGFGVLRAELDHKRHIVMICARRGVACG